MATKEPGYPEWVDVDTDQWLCVFWRNLRGIHNINFTWLSIFGVLQLWSFNFVFHEFHCPYYSMLLSLFLHQWCSLKERFQLSTLIIKLTQYFSPNACNRPFPSSLVPLFQSKSKCKTILMKMTLICMKMKLHAEVIFIYERFRT